MKNKLLAAMGCLAIAACICTMVTPPAQAGTRIGIGINAPYAGPPVTYVNSAPVAYSTCPCMVNGVCTCGPFGCTCSGAPAQACVGQPATVITNQQMTPYATCTGPACYGAAVQTMSWPQACLTVGGPGGGRYYGHVSYHCGPAHYHAHWNCH